MERDLKRIVSFVRLWCRLKQSMSSDDRNHLRSSCSRVGSYRCNPHKESFWQKTNLIAACTLDNRTLSSSHVEASHVQIKIGVWPGTGFEWQKVSTFSVQIFRLGILDYLSRRSISFGKFPFAQTKTV